MSAGLGGCTPTYTDIDFTDVTLVNEDTDEDDEDDNDHLWPKSTLEGSGVGRTERMNRSFQRM